jgi:16S rRNA (cytidine1402-2'-O)-methyltransferase
MNSTGTLFLIPNLLGNGDPAFSLPASVPELVQRLQHFVVEDEKSARKFLKLCGNMPPYDKIELYHLDKHTPHAEKLKLLEVLKAHEVGLLSEAGCPAIADPGAELVSLAHENNIRVVPMVGPSSILLTAMACGMNGQGFTFHGYLPAQPAARNARLREIEGRAASDHYTHLFIETPYRNEHLALGIIQSCQAETRLCIAIDLTLATEQILSLSVGQWRKKGLPELKNRQAVFAIWIKPAKKTLKTKYK